MFIFFKDGRSVWFHQARTYETNDPWFYVLGPRKRRIAEVCVYHIAFWYFDDQELTTYGYDKVDQEK